MVNLDRKLTQDDPNGLLNKVDSATSDRFPNCSLLLLNLSKVKVILGHMTVFDATLILTKTHDNKWVCHM